MITINTYTARYDAACAPAAPRVGSLVRIHETPDDREADGFRRMLRKAGLDTVWMRHMPRARMDVFRVVRV